jgi:hypothetical protein
MRNILAWTITAALAGASTGLAAKPFKGQKLSCEAFLQSQSGQDRQRAGRILQWIDNTLSDFNHFSLPSEHLDLPLAELPGYLAGYCHVYPKHRVADGLLAAKEADRLVSRIN